MVPPLLTFDGKLHQTDCVSCAFLSIKTKRNLEYQKQGVHQAGWVNMILCKKYPVLLIKSLKNDSKIQDPRQLVWPNSCVLAEWVSPSHSGSFLW